MDTSLFHCGTTADAACNVATSERKIMLKALGFLVVAVAVANLENKRPVLKFLLRRKVSPLVVRLH